MKRDARLAPGADEAVSAAGAVVAVCCALWFLASPLRSAATVAAVGDAPLLVVWVERTRATMLEAVSAPAPETVAVRTPTRDPAARRDDGDPGPVAPDAALADGGAPVKLDLSLPSAPVAFRRDGHARVAEVAREPVLQVAFHDRSFGGMLGRMTRASLCAELRRALLEQPASAAAIDGAMSRHGCTGQPRRRASP